MLDSWKFLCYTTVYKTVEEETAMTRDRYFKQLKVALWPAFDQEESEEILSDYREYFDQGTQEGLTEEALFAKFGAPRAAAAALKTERKGRGLSRRAALLLLQIVAGFLLLLAMQGNPMTTGGFQTFAGGFLVLLAAGFIRKPGGGDRTLFRHCVGLGIAAVILFVVEAILIYILITRLQFLMPEEWYGYVGPVVRAVLKLLYLFPAAVLVWAVGKADRLSVGGLSMAMLSAGILEGMIRFLNLFQWIDDLSMFPLEFLYCVVPASFGLPAVALLYLLVTLKGRVRRGSSI